MGGDAENLVTQRLQEINKLTYNQFSVAARHSHSRPFAAATVGAVADAYQVPAHLLGDTGLDPLDLMVCDEAHRSSGSAEKSWTVVHDQDAIPALRRLYMTAMPRIWAPPAFKGREGAFQPLQEDFVCSMDDTAVFGPQVHTLGLQEAIDRGLLAPFEIAVLELRDPATHPGLVERQPLPWGAGVGETRSEDQVQPERIAAIQAGLLQACVQRKLRRVITFHTRTIEARYFAETLNQTAERLHAENPANSRRKSGRNGCPGSTMRFSGRRP